ncbi:hypothetical protein SMACR_07808 [Sordaria macrospora]|uniref:WGS project CABT00000000 data, contig 2.41 n=2 Tax=Sordaria macrospora TaxID=5147 RepID=F7W7Y3_SORMK|nr:uncharacterized protein SMAC_07808 [Sordaria macrospora k-hell]KAA8629932.1 hypothetical protein SMACR_07808 [Sordaria macrospora]KAH7635619.1 hypothetical protein B0T09DRAFT_25377 [Sordaria sp. MPI-SDFR-AT-0083]WPJ64122.1 hypothetical protein SMAC4_07808 [Sordaria macrospora]CCC13626.1 unnamed protein product [Sordaria macrospora k-hell]
MPSFDRYYASSSPVVTMPAEVAHNFSFGKSYLDQQASLSQPISWPQLLRNCSAAGRKRSRDEAAVNLDPPEKIVEPVIKESEDEWVYGPGMTLIRKKSGYVADASSQSGTWVDEKAQLEAARKSEEALSLQQQMSQERPSLRSHKSQRLDPRSSNSTLSSRGGSPLRDTSNPMTASPDSLAGPIVDDFTVHLGIGWARIPESKQPAARGWARYIENHYSVTNAKILLESHGLEAYLVEATEGYFLFAENLRQGRLVSKTADGMLQNLKGTPPVFDGPVTMDASQTTRPTNAGPSIFDVASEMDMS